MTDKLQEYQESEEAKEQMLLEVGRVLGKREMLLYIQKACVAKGGTLTLEDINKYSVVVAVDEMVWKDDVEQWETEVDQDIRNASLHYCK